MDRAELAAAQWAKEMPGLDLLPMEVVGRLSEATQLISRSRLEPLFASFDLQRGEFDVLATLRRAGAPYALTPTLLYGATMISSGGMTNRLDRLEKAALIERQPNPEDRRGVLVALTEKGLELVNRVVPAHVENERQALSVLTEEEQIQLNGLLAKLLHHWG
ncbi:MarR family winged helix-turn-helix transcriptional regulator [Hydrogenophaga sp.]|uniref:MarR family winged helix-turn-helix transcriptional regulator n=1 Tax=Hydrogenophaga sp. TaxID=1904254 RepID=UPI0035688E66